MDIMTTDYKLSVNTRETIKKKQLSKRFFDIVFGVVSIILISPVYLLIILIIKIWSPASPVFFSHWRVGQNGRYFKCLKFRTMVPDAEEILDNWKIDNPALYEEFQKGFKLEHDPRVVRVIGTILRKTSLDELPQLINVIKGDMSLVGPRPIVMAEIEKYSVYFDSLVTIRPGITGLWQVSGRSDVSYEERIMMDIEYVHNISLWRDIRIILRTLYIVFKKAGAY